MLVLMVRLVVLVMLGTDTSSPCFNVEGQNSPQLRKPAWYENQLS